MIILVSQPSSISTHDGGRVAESKWGTIRRGATLKLVWIVYQIYEKQASHFDTAYHEVSMRIVSATSIIAVKPPIK